MSKPFSVMVPCPGVTNDGLAGHSMRDFCSSCAPHWEQYPTCPTHHRKLPSSGFCSDCKKFYREPERLDLSEYKGFA